MRLESTESVYTVSDETSFEYRSRFDDWYQNASVRAQPRRVFLGNSESLLFFSPKVVPLANHAMVIEREVADALLLEHAIHHLSFTNELEHGLVNKVTHQLVHAPEFGFLPEQMRLDAHKIFCDEAYHALFSADLRCQLERERRTNHPQYHLFPFTTKIQEIKAHLAPHYHQQFEVLAAVVSETLISSTLGVVPRDKRVVKVIRDVIWDHAVDEGLHHSYFSQLLEVLWPRLPRHAQSVLGQTLPALIEAFLLPDFDGLHQTLSHFCFSAKERCRIIDESYSPGEVQASLLSASRATRALFERFGVLDLPENFDAFAEKGLLHASS